MKRELPPKPNLEHLKSQAKDLVDAHRRGVPEAFARIRAAVPDFSRRSDEEIARATFALHDAQSAIAREYGFASWAALRARVTAPDPLAIQGPDGQKLSPEIDAALREAMALRGTDWDVPTPPAVPVLPVRNAVVFPGTLVPLDIHRPASVRAIDAVLNTRPRFVAMFAQRAIEIEHPTSDDLHPTGCLCIARVVRLADERHPAEQAGPGKPGEPSRGSGLIVVEGIRWVKLDRLEQIDPYYLARVSDASLADAEDAQIGTLDGRLRALAHQFAELMPTRVQVHAAIDRAARARELADLVMAHLDVPVADKASYAEETELPCKLDHAIAVLGAELAKAQAYVSGKAAP